MPTCKGCRPARMSPWGSPCRRRTCWPAAAAALQALGRAGAMPVPMPVLWQVTEGWCWGAVYVLEGSRLGAQVLVRRVQTEQPEAPVSYLAHGDSAVLWPAFLRQLEAGAQQCDEQELRRGVEDAFTLFLQG